MYTRQMTTDDRTRSTDTEPNPEALQAVIDALQRVEWRRADLISVQTAAAFCSAVAAERAHQEDQR